MRSAIIPTLLLAVAMPATAQRAGNVSFASGAHSRIAGTTRYPDTRVTQLRLGVDAEVFTVGRFTPLITFGTQLEIFRADDAEPRPADAYSDQLFPSTSGGSIGAGTRFQLSPSLTLTGTGGIALMRHTATYAEGEVAWRLTGNTQLIGAARYAWWSTTDGYRVWFAPLSLGFRFR